MDGQLFLVQMDLPRVRVVRDDKAMDNKTISPRYTAEPTLSGATIQGAARINTQWKACSHLKNKRKFLDFQMLAAFIIFSSVPRTHRLIVS